MSSFCPSKPGVVKFKVKKGKLVGTLAKLPKPCSNLLISGSYSVYKKADGSYYLRGPYHYAGAKNDPGNATCNPI